MEKVVKIVTEALKERKSEKAAEIAHIIIKKLEQDGLSRPLEKWDETKTNNECSSGLIGRTCYRVNHGDGTYSEPWCDEWHCL